MPYRLRLGTADDLARMTALDVLCFAEVFRFSAAAMKRFSQGPGKWSLLAESEAGELLGFIVVSVRGKGMRMGYVVTLDVAPAHRRRGIGAELLRAAEAKAARDGAGTMILDVSVENVDALALYRRAGYQPFGYAQDFYGKGLDARSFMKQLDEPATESVE